jgi:hypothetical protein
LFIYNELEDDSFPLDPVIEVISVWAVPNYIRKKQYMSHYMEEIAMTRYPADGLPPDFEKAVKVLMSEPAARDFVSDVRNCMKADSEYLFYNHLTVGTQVDRLLKDHGIRWTPSVFENCRFRVLHIALESIGQSDKNAR